MSVAEWTDIHGIDHWRIVWSSYRKLALVGFERTTTGFCSDALTDWAIRPWVQYYIIYIYYIYCIFILYILCMNIIYINIIYIVYYIYIYLFIYIFIYIYVYIYIVYIYYIYILYVLYIIYIYIYIYGEISIMS